MSPFLSTLGGGSSRGFGRGIRRIISNPGIPPDPNTLRETFFSTSGFAVPAGYAGFYMSAAGAGGGGGYRTGGGGGAFIEKALITAPAGTTFTVHVGTGGVAATPYYTVQYATATQNICYDAYGDVYPCSGPDCCVITPHPTDPNLYPTGDCNCFQNTYQYVTGYVANPNLYSSGNGGQSGVSRSGQQALAGGGLSSDNGGGGGTVTLTGVTTYTAIFNGGNGGIPSCGYGSGQDSGTLNNAGQSVNGIAGGLAGFSSGVCPGGGGGACGGGGTGGTGATPGNGNEAVGTAGNFPGGGGGGGGTCNANWCNPGGGSGAGGRVLIYY
jgi:hypothetical protein